SDPRAVGPRRDPKRRPSNQDFLEPSGRLRPLVRETWMRPEPAPQVNPDTVLSALPTAVTARESVACRSKPAHSASPAPVLASLVDTPPDSAAMSQTTERTITRKPKPACPIEALRALRPI